jgi:hypothetical protein
MLDKSRLFDAVSILIKRERVSFREQDVGPVVNEDRIAISVRVCRLPNPRVVALSVGCESDGLVNIRKSVWRSVAFVRQDFSVADQQVGRKCRVS